MELLPTTWIVAPHLILYSLYMVYDTSKPYSENLNFKGVGAEYEMDPIVLNSITCAVVKKEPVGITSE